jgi:hypothetical protein
MPGGFTIRQPNATPSDRAGALPEKSIKIGSVQVDLARPRELRRIAGVEEFMAATLLKRKILSVIPLCLGIHPLLACSCAPPPPPCQAFWEAPMVYLGTVTEVSADNPGRLVIAQMRIDQAYRGVSEKTLTLVDDGMCNGPTLVKGEQYVMYTDRPNSGRVSSRGCARRRNAKFAQEDLEYFASLSSAAQTGMVFGKALIRNDGQPETPATQTLIELTGKNRTYAATTDGEGASTKWPTGNTRCP